MSRRLLPSVLLFHAACAAPPAVPLPAPVPLQVSAERPPQAFTSDLASLETAIRQRLSAEPGEFGIAVVDIETGRTLGINDRLVMHAASTMKVPVLLELYRVANSGHLALDDAITVRNRFRSIADTAHFYSLSPEDDSEHALYQAIGGTVTFRDLARRMIVRSSNLATNILIDRLGAERVQQTTERVGGAGMRVLRGVEDGPAFNAGMNNTTTARGYAAVLASLARCDILPPASCEEILAILSAQEFTEMIPAGIPQGVPVANKTGWITGIQHDGAIVMPRDAPWFVLVVLSRGGADTAAVRRAAADVARLTWDALGPGGSLRPQWPAPSAALLRLHAEVRLPAFPAPRLPHDELWSALLPIADASPLIAVEHLGTSAGGRPLRLLRSGSGATRVLLWSQMHGDETTASRALADVFNFIATRPDDERVRRWSERLTILAVPMLNPDGADAHRRRGTHGIDINRDARSLATPEGRALRSVQERYQPRYGFNLHDQNPRSRVGSTSRIAAMSLLAPPPDSAATETPSFRRAQRLASYLARELSPLVGEHLTRYDDSYNARAFGDGMQSWGVGTVLIETGSWQGDEAKHYLRTANFIAIVAALDAIADEAYVDAPLALYRSLPQNGRPVNDLIIRGGRIVLQGLEPVRADIAIDAAAVGGPAATQIVDIGDLREGEARDTLDASGLFIHPQHPAASLQPGEAAAFTLRRSADPGSEVVWTVVGTVVRQLIGR